MFTEGSVYNYTENVFNAILSMWDSLVKWPVADAHRATKDFVFEKDGIPEVVGFVEGILFPLEL